MQSLASSAKQKANPPSANANQPTTSSSSSTFATRIQTIFIRRNQRNHPLVGSKEEIQKLADNGADAEGNPTDSAARRAAAKDESVDRRHQQRRRRLVRSSRQQSTSPPVSFFTWPCSCVICLISLLLIILLFLLSGYLFGAYFRPNIGQAIGDGDDDNIAEKEANKLALENNEMGQQQQQQPMMLMVEQQRKKEEEKNALPKEANGEKGVMLRRVIGLEQHPLKESGKNGKSAEAKMAAKELYQAVKEGNYRQVERPKQTPKASTNSERANAVALALPSTPVNVARQLLHAAKYGQTELLRSLLDRHRAAAVNINGIRNAYGNSPLHLAATYGHLDTVQLLLQRNADVGLQNSKSQTPLFYAACEGKEQVVLLLLRAGADVNARGNGGDTPLHCAAEEGWARVVQLLITNGASVNARNEQGFTPLHWAAKYDKRDACFTLLRNGADLEATVPTQNDVTALHLAALEGHNQIVHLLLEWGADVSKRDRHGWTALHYATRNDHFGCVKLLLKHWRGEMSPRDSAILSALIDREDRQIKPAIMQKVFAL